MQSPEAATDQLLLLLGVHGNLHCVSLPSLRSMWSVSLSPPGRANGGGESSTTALLARSISGATGGGRVSTGSCASQFQFSSFSFSSSSPGLSSDAATPSVATPMTAASSSAAASSSGGCYLCNSAAAAGGETGYSESQPSPTVSSAVSPLLSPQAWSCVLSDAATTHETSDDGDDESALNLTAEWVWGGASDCTAGEPSDPPLGLRDAVARWNRRCCPAHRLLATVERTESYADVVLAATGCPARLQWQDGSGGVAEHCAAAGVGCSDCEPAEGGGVSISLLVTFTTTKIAHPTVRPARGTTATPVAAATPPHLLLKTTTIPSVTVHTEAGPCRDGGHGDDSAPPCFISSGGDSGKTCLLLSWRGAALAFPPDLQCVVASLAAACRVDCATGTATPVPFYGCDADGGSREISPGISVRCRGLPESVALGAAVLSDISADDESSSSLSSSSSSSSSDPSDSSEDDEAAAALMDRWRQQAVDALAREAHSDSDDSDSSSDDDTVSSTGGSSRLDRADTTYSLGRELMVLPQRRKYSSCSAPEFGPSPWSDSPLSPTAARPGGDDARAAMTAAAAAAAASATGGGASSFFDDHFDPLLLLGRGASGAALLVRHRVTGVFYAVKVLIARDYATEREILQEVRLHAMLDHQRLVRYYACWSEVVTPQRAQQLAFVGLARPREALPAIGGVGVGVAASASNRPNGPGHPPRASLSIGGSSSQLANLGDYCGGSGRNSSPNNPHHRSSGLDAAGWENLKLDLADQSGHVMMLVGDESESTVATSVEASRRQRMQRSHFSRVQRIDTTTSSSDDDDDYDDDSSSGGGSNDTELDSNSDSDSDGSPAVKRAAGGSRTIIGSRVVFLQMEFCQMTLAQHLTTRPCVDRAENIVIALQLLEGLRYMHRRGVLHRDIKPTNIFVDFRCQLVAGEEEEDDDDSYDDDDDGQDSDGRKVEDGQCGRAVLREHRVQELCAGDGDGTATDSDGDGGDSSSQADCEVVYAHDGTPCLEDPSSPECLALCVVRSKARNVTPLLPAAAGCVAAGSCVPWMAVNSTECFESQADSIGFGTGHGSLFPPRGGGGPRANNAATTANNSGNDPASADQEQRRRAALSFYQEEALAMLMNSPRLSSAELLRSRLPALLLRGQRWRGRNPHRGSANDAGASTAEAAALENVPPPVGSTRARRRVVRRLARWLQRHLLQARLGDFGLAKVVPTNQHQQQSSPCSNGSGSGGGGGGATSYGSGAATADGPWAQPSFPAATAAAAAAASSSHTTGVGSPLYAPPEQIRSGTSCERMSFASDGYSLGIVLAELYMQPTTVAERLHLLRQVREGRFPAKEHLEQFPELAAVRGLVRAPVRRRMRLDCVRALLRRALVACVGEQVAAAPTTSGETTD